MLSQLSGHCIETQIESFDYWADQLEKIPMIFQNFFGSTDQQKILDMINYCVHNYDVGHVVLDNLQFMLSGQGKGFDKFEVSDLFISNLRKIATEKNVHITVVIHPWKSENEAELGI